MKLQVFKSENKSWGIWLEGYSNREGCIVPGGGIYTTEDFTSKHMAHHIVKCVNAFDGVVDIDATIKEFMEWRAEKALLGK